MIAVTVTLILDCDSGEAADAVNETLREHQRTFSPQSCLIDYAIGQAVRVALPAKFAPSGVYNEGDAFISI